MKKIRRDVNEQEQTSGRTMNALERARENE